MKPAARHCRGQATTEFVVLALVLLPLLLVVPLMGKYLDLMQAAEAASRFVAFEGTVHHGRGTGWKADAVLAEEVRRRYFGESSATVRTGDQAQDMAAHRNVVWSDHRGRPLLLSFTRDVSASAQREGLTVFSLNRRFWDDALDLPDQTFHVGSVSVSPANVAGLPPFDRLNLSITRRTGVLVDSWAATSVADVRARVTDSPLLYPFAPLESAGELMGQFTHLLTDPRFRPGLHEWDVVPCDRLAGGCR